MSGKGSWFDVCALAEVQEGEIHAAAVAGTPVILVRDGPHVRAYEDDCPHLHYPLSTGGIDQGEIICFWHGAAFDLATGRKTCGPGEQDLRAFEVRLRGDRIELRLD